MHPQIPLTPFQKVFYSKRDLVEMFCGDFKNQATLFCDASLNWQRINVLSRLGRHSSVWQVWFSVSFIVVGEWRRQLNVETESSRQLIKGLFTDILRGEINGNCARFIFVNRFQFGFEESCQLQILKLKIESEQIDGSKDRESG